MKLKNSLIMLGLSLIIAANGILHANEKSKKIDELILQYYKLSQFNGTVLVAENSKIILKKGYGKANFEWNIDNTPDTKFRIGSLTKQFTSMLIMQLVDEDKLTLDTKLSAVLPSYRKDTGDKITIHNLLNHTSGIPNYTSLPNFISELSRNPISIEVLISKYCSGDLQFEPGSKYAYSNSGYIILGAIIEKVAGKPYEQVLQEHILNPAKMKNSGYDHSNVVIEKRASGYQRTLEGLVENASYLDMSIPYAAGGLYSTVEDLYLWDQVLYTDALLSGQAKEKMFTPGLGDYAYGWGVRHLPVGTNQEKKTVIAHLGGINGFASLIRRVVDDKNLVILLNNDGEPDLFAISNGILDILYGRTPPSPKEPIAPVLLKKFKEEGMEAALKMYREIKENKEEKYIVNESQLNQLGYQLMNKGKIEEAIAILKINVETFPDSFNVYDSLAEAYMNANQKELAIRNYAKSLELNPKNNNAILQLQKLAQ